MDVSASVIDALIDIYNSGKNYQTTTMNKLSGHSDIVFALLDQIDNIDVNRIHVCHFYKHSTPYYPHTDFHELEGDNIVIPLQVINGSNPSLVVFDQWLDSTANTWTFDSPVTFKHNTGVRGRPCDYKIEGNTNEDIPDDLYTYLNHFPKRYWFGLSGTAYEFRPGNIIQFGSKQIHATSKLHCESKLGLTIRYKAE